MSTELHMPSFYGSLSSDAIFCLIALHQQMPYHAAVAGIRLMTPCADEFTDPNIIEFLSGKIFWMIQATQPSEHGLREDIIKFCCATNNLRLLEYVGKFVTGELGSKSTVNERRKAAVALSKVEADSALVIELLINTLAHQDDAKIEQTLTTALRRIGTSDFVDRLVNYAFMHQEAKVRKQATIALGNLHYYSKVEADNVIEALVELKADYPDLAEMAQATIDKLNALKWS